MRICVMIRGRCSASHGKHDDDDDDDEELYYDKRQVKCVPWENMHYMAGRSSQ